MVAGDPLAKPALLASNELPLMLVPYLVLPLLAPPYDIESYSSLSMISLTFSYSFSLVMLLPIRISNSLYSAPNAFFNCRRPLLAMFLISMAASFRKVATANSNRSESLKFLILGPIFSKRAL